MQSRWLLQSIIVSILYVATRQKGQRRIDLRLISSDEHDEVRMQPPTEAMRRSVLEQRQVRSETEQPMVWAPDSRQESAHRGSWLTRPGRLVAVAEVEPEVLDAGETVAVCAVVVPTRNKSSGRALKCIVPK